MKRRLSRSAIGAAPEQLWNTCIDLIATEPHDALSAIQRQVQLVFLYDAEVQNGGHLQYFLNLGTGRLSETVAALKAMDLAAQADILSKAAQLWMAQERDPIDDADEYGAEALAGEFDEFDSAYYSCSPKVSDALDKHFKMHRDEYVTLID